MKIRIIKAPNKSNKYSLGGDFSNGVIQINSGGLHSTNPMEGVQMGVDNQGIPNLVEEGEVIYNDYVYSNRLRVPKAIRQKYKLRGVTFADAAKQVQKESEERPNDKIAKDTMNAIMSDLMQEQEMIRAKKNSNRYSHGGKLGNLFDGLGEGSQNLKPYSNFTKLNNDDFYTPEYMNFWNWFNSNSNTDAGKEWLRRINSGEFGPVGGNTFNAADISRLAHDYKKGPVHNAFALAATQYNKENPVTPVEDPYNPYTKRWIREKGADGIWRTQLISDDDWNATPEGRTYLMRNPNLKEGNTVTSSKGDKDIYYDVIPEEFSDLEGIVPSKVAPMKDNWLRYAPIIGGGISVLNDLFGGNEPDYTNADLYADAIRGANRQIGYRPIGNYLRYTPFDRDYYINKLNANTAAGRRAAINTSGGNRAAALAGVLATDYNYGNQLGDLARQAEDYNLAQRQKVEEFNRGTNISNSEMGTKVDMFNAENAAKQASLYGSLASMRQGILDRNRAEKSANLTNFIQSLGDLGRENTDRDMLRWLADLGVLTYNPKGEYTRSNKSSKGGKLKKRGGFTI